MNSILKRELGACFGSMLGYLYIASALFILNLAFYFYNIAGASADMSKVFSFMLTTFIFFVPILTMRSFAKEFREKTDRLWLTAPIGRPTVVMAKFVSCYILLLLPLTMTLLWPPLLRYAGGLPWMQVFWGSLLGLVVVGSAYISIGLFISSLTTGPASAAAGTLTVFLLVYLLDGWVSAYYAAIPTGLLAVLRFAAIHSRFDRIASGLLPLADILYLLSVTLFFFFITCLNLGRRHWR